MDAYNIFVTYLMFLVGVCVGHVWGFSSANPPLDDGPRKVCGNCALFYVDQTANSIRMECRAPEEHGQPAPIMGQYFGTKRTSPDMNADTCPAWVKELNNV